MTHVDIQHVLAMTIVALAALVIGKRLWGQVQGFRSRPRRRAVRANKTPSPPASSPLIQVQLKPPAHLKRPPADGK